MLWNWSQSMRCSRLGVGMMLAVGPSGIDEGRTEAQDTGKNAHGATQCQK